MNRVLEALRGIIPVYHDEYRPDNKRQTAPDQFATFVTMTIEDSHSDDVCTGLKTFVYMTLWSKQDPSDMAARIRDAMRAAGFAMSEERTGASSGDSYYTEGGNYFGVRWTWVCWEDASCRSI